MTTNNSATCPTESFANLCAFIGEKSRAPPFAWDFFPGYNSVTDDIYNHSCSRLFLAGNLGFTTSPTHPNPAVNEMLNSIDRGFYDDLFVDDRCASRDWWAKDVIGTVVARLCLLNATIEAKRQLIFELGGASASDKFIISLAGLQLYINTRLVLTARTSSGKVLERIPLVPENVVNLCIRQNATCRRSVKHSNPPPPTPPYESLRSDEKRGGCRPNVSSNNDESNTVKYKNAMARFQMQKPIFVFLLSPPPRPTTSRRRRRPEEDEEEGICMLVVKDMHPALTSHRDFRHFRNRERNAFDGYPNPPDFASLVRSEKKRLVAFNWVPSLDEYSPPLPPKPPPPQENRNAHTIEVAKSCSVCMDRPPIIVCVPCGHLVMCAECSAEVVVGDGGKCPVCRKETTSMVTVFT